MVSTLNVIPTNKYVLYMVNTQVFNYSDTKNNHKIDITIVKNC